jgi:DNA polymerase V
VPQYAKGLTLNVAAKSDNTWELRELAFNGLARIYRPGYGYRRAGVTLGGLDLADLVAKRLWEDEWFERQRRLMAAVDRLNSKYGCDTARCGIFPTDGAWRTRFAKRSPRYTTRWAEICIVAAKWSR